MHDCVVGLIFKQLVRRNEIVRSVFKTTKELRPFIQLFVETL